MLICLNFHRKSNKPTKKRRRVATVAQRRAANIRERRRMFNLNEAFDRLRNKVCYTIQYDFYILQGVSRQSVMECPKNPIKIP